MGRWRADQRARQRGAGLHTDIANQSHTEGNVVSLDADATDADLDTLVYSATGLPGGITINASTGVISGTLSGTSSGTHNVIDHRVSDGIDTDTDPFTWTVADVAAPNMALDFDGTNDHVTFGAAPASASRASPSRPGSGATARASTRAPARAA